MSLPKPLMPSANIRVKVFVDFWNVVINARSQTSSDLPIDVRWQKLTEAVINQATSVQKADSILSGCYIFGSNSQSNGKELKFKNETLDTYGSLDGLYFDFRERVSKETTQKCGNCGAPMVRSSESGIDILLTVEMIKHANMGDHDYLALVSSDRDFLPLLQYLKDQGQRVLHISPGPPHRDMRTASWKQVGLKDHFVNMTKIRNDKILVLTIPAAREKTAQAESILQCNGIEYTLIDMSKEGPIDDRDLKFIISNMKIGFKMKVFGMAMSETQIGNMKIKTLRDGINSGEVLGNFPFIVQDGVLTARPTEQGGWFTGGSQVSGLFRHKR